METKKARRAPGDKTNTATIPEMDCEAKLQQIGETLHEFIEEIHDDPERQWQLPFLFARAIRRTNARYSTDYNVGSVPAFIQQFCEERDIDNVENFTDMVALSMDKVSHCGPSALDVAYEKACRCNRPWCRVSPWDIRFTNMGKRHCWKIWHRSYYPV